MQNHDPISERQNTMIYLFRNFYQALPFVSLKRPEEEANSSAIPHQERERGTCFLLVQAVGRGCRRSVFALLPPVLTKSETYIYAYYSITETMHPCYWCSQASTTTTTAQDVSSLTQRPHHANSRLVLLDLTARRLDFSRAFNFSASFDFISN